MHTHLTQLCGRGMTLCDDGPKFGRGGTFDSHMIHDIDLSKARYLKWR